MIRRTGRMSGLHTISKDASMHQDQGLNRQQPLRKPQPRIQAMKCLCLIQGLLMLTRCEPGCLLHLTQSCFFSQARTRAELFCLDAAKAASQNVNHARKVRHVNNSGAVQRENVQNSIGIIVLKLPISSSLAEIFLWSRSNAPAFKFQRKRTKDVNELRKP